jgi:hypothetical protein
MNAIVKIEGQAIPGLEVPVEVYGIAERVKRSMKLFIILLLTGVLCILIPILHFVLVPGFLLASFVFGFLKFNEVYAIDLKNFRCPSCQSSLKDTQIFLKQKNPISRIFCFECRKQIYFEIVKFN